MSNYFYVEADNWTEKGTYLQDSGWKPEYPSQPLLYLNRWDARPGETLFIQHQHGNAMTVRATGTGATILGKQGVDAQGGFSNGVVGRAGVPLENNKYPRWAYPFPPDGTCGVLGFSEVPTRQIHGVGGQTLSSNGAGVIGQHLTSGPGVSGWSQNGDGVHGWTSAAGHSGVFGQNDAKTGDGDGVLGRSFSDNGAGVHGVGVGLHERRAGAVGVYGYGQYGCGVYGFSDNFHGVVGVAKLQDSHGVFGISGHGIGVAGASAQKPGVVGESKSADGVVGVSQAKEAFAGVAGMSTRGGVGVAGISAQGIGLYATAPRYAAYFEGDVLIKGNLAIDAGGAITIATPGNKFGVVQFADGSHRLVSAIESPEAWFEDFGEAVLVNGKAHIKLGRDFAQTIDARRYHVFLTPYGETAGLYVSRRTRAGFDVAERQPAKSRVRFSWRVVARPKSAKHKRFAKTTAPQTFDRVRSTISRTNASRSRAATALNTKDIDMQARRLLKRTKPTLLKPPKRPKVDE